MKSKEANIYKEASLFEYRRNFSVRNRSGFRKNGALTSEYYDTAKTHVKSFSKVNKYTKNKIDIKTDSPLGACFEGRTIIHCITVR